VCFAAKKLGIPIILHESDAVMGRANQLIAKMASQICLGFPTNYKLQTTNYQLTGNPLRPEITRGSREEGLRITGFSGTRPILLVMGGSQGAQAINEWTTRNLKELITMCDVIHLYGSGKDSSLQPARPNGSAAGRATCNYFPLPFANKELAHLYACTNIAISRAGAGSIAELLGNGIPTILIPISGLAHDHQLKNALSLQERKVALLVTQNDMDKELMNVFSQLMKNSEEYQLMKDRIRKMQGGDSAGQIVDIISNTLVGRY
jgi:UDP-N-acetylglucosamine--N-acetylmuramyl-(pentapeptide) pyrophosphoryl-undecaprenol N-acetylglucosamine transferase